MAANLAPSITMDRASTEVTPEINASIASDSSVIDPALKLCEFIFSPSITYKIQRPESLLAA